MFRLSTLVLSLCLSCAARSQELDRSVFIRLASSLVKIEALAADGALSLGTGLTIAPGRVATSCHVTRIAANISMLRDGLRWRVVGQPADVARYSPIAPLEAKLKAFWQHSAESLPYFMQANSLTVDQKWAPLLQLANRWGSLDKTSIEPWIARGSAYEGLARPGDAIKAFEEALKRNPDSNEAWFGLGHVYAKQGNGQKFQLMQQNLERLNPDLAAELAKEQPNKSLRSNQSESQL